MYQKKSGEKERKKIKVEINEMGIEKTDTSKQGIFFNFYFLFNFNFFNPQNILYWGTAN